jgi:general secretion pathway protein N
VKRLWLFGFVLFLLAAAIQFPAAWLAPWTTQATQQRWRLGSVEGTIWRGRATLSAFDRPSGRWHPGYGIRWHFVWSELLRGRAALQLDFDGGGGSQLSATFQGWSIERLDAALPVAYAAALLPGPLGEYGWSGTAQARSSSFACRWTRAVCTGQVDLQLHDAAVAALTGPVLGDFRVRVTAEGEALRFDVGTLRGRLMISGAGELNAESLRFSGEAEARGTDAAGLETVLRAIGRPGSAPGRYLIDYRETLKRAAG